MAVTIRIGDAKMLDPTEIFVVNTITRQAIAGDLSFYLDMNGVPRDEEYITEDDDRLTPEVCREYAHALGNIDLQDLSEEDGHDAELELMRATLLKIGVPSILVDFEYVDEEY